MKYNKFHASEPTSSDKRCVYVDVADSAMWKTAECNSVKRYICQKGENPESTPTTTTTTAKTTTTTTITTSKKGYTYTNDIIII